jgi:hypothetical protein
MSHSAHQEAHAITTSVLQITHPDQNRLGQSGWFSSRGYMEFPLAKHQTGRLIH